MTIEESINLPKPGTMKTETLNDLASVYLDRLEKGECEPADQKTAAVILGERIRLEMNMTKAAQQAARILAEGIERERTG